MGPKTCILLLDFEFTEFHSQDVFEEHLSARGVHKCRFLGRRVISIVRCEQLSLTSIAVSTYITFRLFSKTKYTKKNMLTLGVGVPHQYLDSATRHTK